ncbi:Reductase C-terminal [Jatrophihabitans endophyticus]|uniref:Reductase C-terminal n=1 Tax=Jatrophihabitans endophyticus TaxID=1206085 RepID=A0A1M5PPX0_9ACTN|nr:FAD-dependent oxidoreductase [Jatrophihabitans endophyticus]SHH03798.1 Reductase C-terminal [Jatrophihabitans endophyticus]
MSVVVIGAGLGGLRTAEALRRHGCPDPITMVGAESHAPYDRPPLTKAVLRGTVDDTTLPADLAELGVDLRTGRRATGLDTARRRVRLDDGTELGYESLVLATGAVPRTLPAFAGLDGVHVVRTIDDALRLRTAVERSRRLVVVGGGFVGCEVAASARLLGAEVDLVEVLPAPLARVLGPIGSQLVTDLLVEQGVHVRGNTGVAEVTGDGAVAGLRLQDGTELATTEVVLGLGVVPDLDWLAGSGVETGDGIVCDAVGRTTAPDVWAVGDAAAWHHPLAGRRVRLEHWTNVVDQAAVVGRAVATGEADEPADVPYFWSDVFDTKIQALGFVDPADDVHVASPGGRTVLVYSRSGRLTALVGFSAARHVMRLRSAVADRAPVEEVLALLAA